MSETLSFKETLALAQTECRVEIACLLTPVSRAPGLPGASCANETLLQRGAAR
jgi:hypothetical protein